jgi:hypothetical protein
MNKKKVSPHRGIIKRYKREIRHNKRAKQEHSKFLTTIPFIDAFFVYWNKGKEDEAHSNFIVSFNLIEPIYVKDFKEFLEGKIGGYVIESIQEG